jgi:hypothetical protein
LILAFVLGFASGFFFLIACVLVSDWLYERSERKRKEAAAP